MPFPRKRPSLDQYTMAESRKMLCEMTGRRHVLLAGRGAAGIWVALRALDLRDEYVLIPANTCYIVLWAVLKSGNKPLLVDVDLETGNPTPPPVSLPVHGEEEEDRKQKDIDKTFAPITDANRKAKAVIPCHMYGIGAGMAAICEWGKAHDVHVIEDAALALGGQADGRPAGSWGDVSVLSFGLGKIADNQVGGAVLTDDDRLAAEIEKLLAEMPVWDDGLAGLTNQWNALYWALHQYEADNLRLLDLYPALFDIYGGLTGYRLAAEDWRDLPGLLRDLPAHLEHRAAMAAVYDEFLVSRNPLPLAPSLRSGEGELIKSDLNLNPFSLQTLVRLKGTYLWRYPLLVEADARDDLLHYLWDNGVSDATRWYPPLRYMTAALAPDIPQPPTPYADSLGARIINLRVDPGVDQTTVEKTARLIEAYFSQ